MEQITVAQGVEMALDAIIVDRLTALVGAGLSMAPPSCLPNAATIAAGAKAKYDGRYGETRAPLSSNIEEQAQFFFDRGELATVYLRTLIDFDAFAGQPNPGHEAIADLLLTGAILTGVTTNVDSLVETAGQMLLGQIAVGIDGATCAALPPERSPYLKIHGCRMSDPDNMVWAPGQVDALPVSDRIQSSAEWLKVRLLDRDLLVVGFWSDWDYLNGVLEQTLGEVRPSRLIVVDPQDPAGFATKAPTLFAIGEQVDGGFFHVRTSGSEFLASLRSAFSRSFVRQVLHMGNDAYAAKTGNAPEPFWLEPPALDNDSLWRLRRDLEGRRPTQAARLKAPPDEPLLGMTLLQLRAAGAVADGPYWLLNGKRVRVIRTPNFPLNMVEAQFQREIAPTVAPDIVVAVGAEEGTLPTDIVRGGSVATIARGNASRWLTRPEAVSELDL